MATKKKDESAPVEPSSIAFPIDTKALKGISAWHEKENRKNAAKREAERALSDIVRKADTLAVLVSDVHMDDHEGTPIEQERYAKRIERVGESLDKVLDRVAELVAV